MESISKYIEESLSRNTEYLIEAVASRKTGRHDTFPREPDKDDIVRFLEGKGFRDMTEPDTDRISGKYYIIGAENPNKTQTFWIKFGDTHIRQFKEFFCRYENLKHVPWADFMVDSYPMDTFEDFRKQVCEYFGWK